MVLRHTINQPHRKRSSLTMALVCLGFLLCPTFLEAASETAILKRIRSGRHSTHARIVLELEGARPLSVGPLSDQGFPMAFGPLISRLRPKALKNRWPSPVLNISIAERDGGSVVWVGFRELPITVEQSLQQKGKNAYNVILDFAPQAPSGAHGSGEPGLPNSIEGDGKASEIQAGRTSGNSQAQAPAHASSSAPTAADTPLDPFAEGDALFLEHSDDLAPAAAQILERYRNVLKAAPKSPRWLLAEYRSGLCHLALGNAKKAEEAFKSILAEYPQHPMAPLAWSGLGQALSRRDAYMEAIQALRTAINNLTEPQQLADAHYYLGRSLFRIGAPKEALEPLAKAMELDPACHVRWPELLRLLGEAYFINQKYGECAKYLLWYLNLEKDVPEKDILLAKIGESLMYTGSVEQAKKIYVYVDKHYPESEGYIISKIRRAEYFEKQNPPNKIAASAIYQELSQRSLTGPLGEFLTFKVATWERERKNYAQALEWIDKGLQSGGTSKARAELVDLKIRVLLDYLREAHDQQDHGKTLKLYQDNEALLMPHMTPETHQLIAQAFEALRMYPAAAELYKSLYTSNSSRNEQWLLNAARNYFSMGDMEHTLAACQSLQGEGLQTEKTMLMGKAYFEQGKYKEASNELTRHIQKNGGIEHTAPEILLANAESLLLSDKAGEGLAFLEKLTGLETLAEGEPRLKVGLLQFRCHQKLKQSAQAILVLENLLTSSGQDEMKDQLTYELARLYLETGQIQKATERLTQLAQSSNSLFKSTAQQELGYLALQKANPVKGSN